MSEDEDRRRLEQFKGDYSFGLWAYVLICLFLPVQIWIFVSTLPDIRPAFLLGLIVTLAALHLCTKLPRTWWRAKADLQAGAGQVYSGVVTRDRGGWRIGGERVAVLRRDRHWLTPGGHVEARCALATRLVLEVKPL